MSLPRHSLLIAAGLGQLVLIVASLAIPHVLGWRQDVAKLRPLTRQVFWTYAGYIWATNLSFGLISALGPGLLLERAPLAGIVCGFMATYWGARVLIQFCYFDRSDAPQGRWFTLGEVALVSLFISLTILYTALALRAFGVLGA